MTEAPSTADERSPLSFVVLVFALSIPLWVLGWKYRIEILPGLPLSAIMVVAPMAAALLLVARQSGRAAVAAHLAKSFDARRIAPSTGTCPSSCCHPR